MTTSKNDFWEQATKEALNTMLANGRVRGTLVSERHHPHFHRSVAQLAEKAGLEYAPRIVITEELALGPMHVRKLPNAGATAIRAVFVNESMMDLYSANLSKAMPPKLEAVMAHEFSHLKHDIAGAMTSKYQLYALPLIAMAGLYIYDRAKAKNEKANGEELHKHINDVTKEEIDKIDAKAKHPLHNKWELEPQWQKNVMQTARYALAGVLGFGVALGTARHGSMGREFRADKFAVDMTGNPEVVKEMLKDLHNAWAKTLGQMPAGKRASAGVLHDAWETVMAYTLHAHPNLEQRLSHIDRLATSRAAQAAPATTIM